MLFLNSSQHDPFDEVALQEWIDGKYRQHGDEDLRRLDASVGQQLQIFWIDARLAEILHHDDRLQQCRERPLLFRSQVQHPVKPAIPMSDHRE